MLVERKEDTGVGRFSTMLEPEPVIPGLVFSNGVQAVAGQFAQ